MKCIFPDMSQWWMYLSEVLKCFIIPDGSMGHMFYCRKVMSNYLHWSCREIRWSHIVISIIYFTFFLDRKIIKIFVLCRMSASVRKFWKWKKKRFLSGILQDQITTESTLSQSMQGLFCWIFDLDLDLPKNQHALVETHFHFHVRWSIGCCRRGSNGCPEGKLGNI